MDYRKITNFGKTLANNERIMIEHNNVPIQSGYENVHRLGEPEGTLKYLDHKEDIEKVINTFISSGYNGKLPKLNHKVTQHIEYFRICLDLYDNMIEKKVYEKDEIYFRSLTMRQDFTDEIKKLRAKCFREASKYTDERDDDFVIPKNYYGYDSIIHERYLIHWDDTEDIDDVKWAFLEEDPIDIGEVKRKLRRLFADYNIREEHFSGYISYIDSIKNTKMYNPSERKTALVRDILSDDETGLRGGYLAKRTVVPTYPGSTRDTGIGDPFTILKVKTLNILARMCAEHLPYSVNCDKVTADSRISRVRQYRNFLHLDFKKFGLAFPRSVINATIEEIASVSGYDTTFLKIPFFTVEIDGEDYATSRGTMLGWLDAINSIAVSAILHDLSKTIGVKLDHVTFNDDVEIGHNLVDVREEIKTAVLAEFDNYGILLSEKKTFNSPMSQFLEEYYHSKRCNLDMRKIQLAVKGYAQSLVQPYPWKSKLLYAMTELSVYSKYAEDRCKSTCKKEFDHETEFTDPLFAGGWHIPYDVNGLDESLIKSEHTRKLGLAFMKWKPPKITSRYERTLEMYEMYSSHEARILNSNRYNEKYRLDKDELDEAREESSIIGLRAQSTANNELLSEKLRNYLLRYEKLILEVPDD